LEGPRTGENFKAWHEDCGKRGKFSSLHEMRKKEVEHEEN
jgi:hypothetical protein